MTSHFELRVSSRLWGVAVTAFLALALICGPQAVASVDARDSGTHDARRCPDDDPCFPIERPKKMAAKFESGTYGTAQGKKMPAWVYRQAKAYVRNHPEVAPRSARTGFDWDFLEWTKERLDTGRCMALVGAATSFLGCDDQPSWVAVERKVVVYCGGTALVGYVSGSPRWAVGFGGGFCLWNQFDD